MIDTRPEIIDQLIDLILEGLPLDQCCHVVGMSLDNLYKWKKYSQQFRDNNGKPEGYEKYYNAIKKLDHATGIWQLGLVRRSFGESNNPFWIRDMTILERRDRKNWGKTEPAEMRAEYEYDPDETFL